MTIKTRTSAKAEAATTATTPTKTTKTLSRARKVGVGQIENAKQADVSDAHIAPIATPNPAMPTQQTEGVALEGLDRPVTGRGVFAVRTLGNAVAVESAFLDEAGNVLRLPAVFPSRQYALEQIDELRNIVNAHFDDLDKALNAAS